MRSGDRGEVEIISPCSHDVLLKPDSVLRSRRIPLTNLLNLSCDCRCYTMSSKCEGFSEVPVLAISGVVDTCSISTGDSWTEGTRGILRFQRKNVAFLKEPGGISRIPRNGIIELV